MMLVGGKWKRRSTAPRPRSSRPATGARCDGDAETSRPGNRSCGWSLPRTGADRSPPERCDAPRPPGRSGAPSSHPDGGGVSRHRRPLDLAPARATRRPPCGRAAEPRAVPGDRVGIWAPNRPEWLIAQFATARIGLILVNVNPAYRASELEYALNKVGAKALLLARQFRSSGYVDMLRELAPGAGLLPARAPARGPPSGAADRDPARPRTGAGLLRVGRRHGPGRRRPAVAARRNFGSAEPA